ncbi:Planctomycete cytochrome C [Prosthecobacter debontii]|uniref:Planctomycete cytochrome C n=1 Tax=Prosthecobacter debontii TaxID=48467 RepID=A0A1T4YLT0_9BACT|nr:c-type cytochrome domain-containing protein [Prosthecobacter debontii]SKB02235.1 Planctomycete cytochrome C [Prosthecobacter debontii]
MKIKLTLAAVAAAFAVSTASAEDVDFEKQILPILKDNCFKCHEKEHEDNGRVKKPKGGLALDSAAAIMKGGKEYPDANVVAGKPDESWLLKTMALPESDEYAMPPEGKGDRVSAENQALIKKWIESGASFGAWKGAE